MFEGENKYILKYNCYATENYCSNISEKIIGCCNNCFEKYNININELTENNLYKNYLINKNNIRLIIIKLLKEVSDIFGKENKTKIVFKLFQHNFNNLYFLVTNFRYFITVLIKIEEFINTELYIFEKVAKNNDYNFDTLIKIKNIYYFIKDNNKYNQIVNNINNGDNNDEINNSFVKEFIDKIYEKKIDNKKIDNKDNYNIINCFDYKLFDINI